MVHEYYEVPYAEGNEDFLNRIGIEWYSSRNLEVIAPSDHSHLELGEHRETETALVLLTGASTLKARTLIVTGESLRVEKFEAKLREKVPNLKKL